MNTFGEKFRLTTFGESHGEAIGCVIDGVPAGVKIDTQKIQNEVNRRKGGGKFATPRVESDKVKIYSGIFNGVTTGAPIGILIFNENQKSKDYSDIENIFRPGHADFTYFHKFGLRDYRGGGRSSARETAVRVAGGALAQIILDEFKIEIVSGVFSVGNIVAEKLDFKAAFQSEIFALDKEDEFKEEILNVKKSHDSVGSSSITIIKNAPKGLGEVLYDKLDARLAAAMMGINGVKAVEIGLGAKASSVYGSQNNDLMGKNGFLTNNSGGILGGISNGDEIVIKTHFKPTPSIFLPQQTINEKGNETICMLRGRHDPCIGIRGSVVATAMARLVIADMLLLNATSKLENLKKIYS